MPTHFDDSPVQMYWVIDGQYIPVGTAENISVTDLGDPEHNGKVYELDPSNEPLTLTFNSLGNDEFVKALFKTFWHDLCNNWRKMHGYPKRRSRAWVKLKRKQKMKNPHALKKRSH